RAICPPTTTSARTTLGSRGSPSACGRWRSDGREGRHPHRGPWRTGESGHGWGSAGVNGKAGGGTARDRQGIPVGHPGVCWCWSPGVPGLGSGPRKTGGGEEGVPLGGREGQVATVGVLGIPHGRATGEVGHFDAVVVHTCVAALTEGGGDVGHFDTVLALSSAVAALPENQFVAHRVLSRVSRTSVMTLADCAELIAEPWTSPKVTLCVSTSSDSSRKRPPEAVSTNTIGASSGSGKFKMLNGTVSAAWAPALKGST